MFLDIKSHGSSFAVKDGFLVVNEQKVPLDEISGLILSTPAITLTGYVLAELNSRNIPITVCNNNYKPVGVFLSQSNYSLIALRAESQAKMLVSTKNKLWQQIIKHKINNSAKVLRYLQHPDSEKLTKLVDNVISGDKTFVEGFAAREYWQSLFDTDFRREQTGLDSINSSLNWGYTILRSYFMRLLTEYGIYGALGVNHKNRYNGFCLADDLIEPYRSLVDYVVYLLDSKGMLGLTRNIKKILSEILEIKIKENDENIKISTAILKTVESYGAILDNKSFTIYYPKHLEEYFSNAKQVCSDVDVRDI